MVTHRNMQKAFQWQSILFLLHSLPGAMHGLKWRKDTIFFFLIIIYYVCKKIKYELFPGPFASSSSALNLQHSQYMPDQKFDNQVCNTANLFFCIIIANSL